MENYRQRRNNGAWRDPREIKLANTLLSQPFAFYGSMVQLSKKQKADLAERNLQVYLKDMVKEISEKNKTLELQIQTLKDVN